MRGTPLFALTLLLLVVQPAAAALPRATPESQGLSSSGLAALVQTLDTEVSEMHSLMIVRRGQVVAEGWWAPYAAEHRHVLYSLSKSFTATAVGFAVAEGRLSLFDPVVGFFPAETPADASARLKAMRVRDLLTMATGHQDEPPHTEETMTVASFLAHPVPHKPGTHFLYNTPATFMAGAVVQKVTGQTVLDYLRPRLFAPLGIVDPVWDTNSEGMTLGGYGLRIRTEEIARFGQLYLQRGVWEGRTLLPPDWIDLATSRQMSNGSNPRSDWDQGYGFQFWRSRHGYRGDGAFGQFCIVLPEHDLVVALTSGTRDMQRVLDLLWEHLLPLLQPQALPADPVGHDRLRTQLAGLALRPAEGGASSLAATAVLDRTFTEADGRRSITVQTGATPGTLEVTWRDGESSHRFPFGYGTWAFSRGPVDAGALARLPDEPVAGTYGWTDESTLVLKVAAYETPFALTHRLTFRGDEVTVTTEGNVAFGPTKRPEWTARAPAR